MEAQEKTGVSGRDPQEWKSTALVDAKGNPYIPYTYPFSSFKSGGKHEKKGRASRLSDVAATLQFPEDRMFFLNRTLPSNWKDLEEGEIPENSREAKDGYYLDIRPVKNPSSRGLNIRYRLGLTKGWLLEFKITWDKTIVPTEVMERIADHADRLYGIGDGRSIGFGRFKVLEFVIDEK